MSEETRWSFIAMLWFLSTIAFSAVFISAAAIGELAVGHIIFAGIILGLIVVGTPILFRIKIGDDVQEKAKRADLDNMLRDMSDDDLRELKRRLSDVDHSEESLVDYLGDDGEFVGQR